MTTTRTTITEIAELALDLATDSGLRAWRGSHAPMAPNAFGGYDFTHGEITIRLADDDTTILLYVFTGGGAMLLSEQASFSPGLAHLAAAYISEVLR